MSSSTGAGIISNFVWETGVSQGLWGPHYYTGQTYIGKISDGLTADQVFQTLRPYAAPSFWPTPRSDGDWSIALPVGPVTHTVDPEGLTIINTTLPGHLLYPGTVFREVQVQGDEIWIVTKGYGNGILPWIDEKLAPGLFQLLDTFVALTLRPELLKDVLQVAWNQLILRQNRDPLILDLDGDGVEVGSLSGSLTHFDYDQDGFAERTGWVSPDDGILVIDDNDNGQVDGAAELFGSPGLDGFEVLETLDTNGDGLIDVHDEEFAKLRVWQDLDSDGVSDEGELITLAEAGIAAIELTRTAVNGTNNGHGVGFEAHFIRADASTGTAQTIYFQTDRQDTADPTPEFTATEGADKLPQLPRSGQLQSLLYVLSTDADFRVDWTALADNAAAMSPDELQEEFAELMLRWAGVDGVDPHGRGQYVDARHLAFVEKFFGDTYRETQRGQETGTYPSRPGFGAAVEAEFAGIISVLKTSFLVQIAQSILSRVDHNEDTLAAVFENPYFAYSLLDLRGELAEGEVASPTPGNMEMVVNLILALKPSDFSAQIDYLQEALSGLRGMVAVAFDHSQQDYAEFMAPLMADIEDPLIRQIATEFASLTAREGTVASEGLVGDAGDNVLIGGKGDDGVDGKDGSDIYIYRSGDGHEWLNDTGPATDTDTLILTDLDPSDITLNRNGDDLLIVVTATGAIIEVNDFFKLWGTASNGIEQIRFADDTVWDRDDIKANTVFTGSPGNNVITDSAQDDVIHGLGGNDYIKIGAGRKEMARAISCGQPMFRRGPAELSCVR